MQPMTRGVRRLTVRALSPRAVKGWLTAGPVAFPCALGRAGSRVRKLEADGATPIGRWRMLEISYRPDRGLRPRVALPVRAIGRLDGWCDEASDRNYNRRVTLPYPASAEAMWRGDDLYDLVIVLDHNARPRRRNGGSAIFMHVAGRAMSPTAGCIALAAAHLRRLLTMLGRDCVVIVLR